MNRPTLRDVRKPPWLAAGAVVVLASGLVAAGDAPARGVSQATVLRGDVTATVGAAGTVQSADTRDLVFGTSGTVTKIEVTPGDKVRAGAVLARLDDADAREKVAVAKAALAAADDTYDKARQGICTGGGSRGGSGGAAAEAAGYTSGPVRRRTPVSRPSPSRTPAPTPTSATPSPTRRPTSRPTGKPTPTPTRTSPKPAPTPTRTSPRPARSPTARPKPAGRTRQGGGRGGSAPGGRGGGGGACAANAVELASAGVTQAEVEEHDAERALAATKLTAPIDGTVLAVDGTVGGQVAGQSRTAFVTLGDLSDLQVQAMFPLGEANRLALGRPATVRLGMLAGRTYRGTVSRVDPAATTSGDRALFGVMISLDDVAPPGLRTGMSATVEVVTAQAENTLYVPAAAVHPESGGLATVLVRQGGRTTTRTVRTGVHGDRYVAVTSGLSAGDHVVLPATTGPDGFPSATFPGT